MFRGSCLKIILLPFAGGNKYCFGKLSMRLSNWHAVEYPGRGSRGNEPLLLDANLIANDVMMQLKDVVRGDDYIIYGHSMGALIGFLLCRKIERGNFKKPMKLI